MTDTTLSLALRLTASAIADGLTVAGKVADRLLGGRPRVCDTSGLLADLAAADQLADAEAERDVYEPDELWSAARVREQEEQFELADGYRRLAEDPEQQGHCRAMRARRSPSNPAVAADPQPGGGGAQNPRSRAHSPEPVAAVDAPGSLSPQPCCANPGHPLLPRSEHPMYADIQDVADAAVVADVLGMHRCYYDDGSAMHYCHDDGSAIPHSRFGTYNQWIEHVSPLIIAELQK